jgi:hypothetical protein
MWNFPKAVFIILAGLAISLPASSDPLTYSHQFDQWASYNAGSAQYDDWLSFRESLPASGVTSITVSGSLDLIGRTCSDPDKAQQIADAMFFGASDQPHRQVTLSLSCDDNTWTTGACSVAGLPGNNLELNVGSGTGVCNCGSTNYTIRPGIAGETGSNRARP